MQECGTKKYDFFMHYKSDLNSLTDVRMKNPEREKWRATRAKPYLSLTFIRLYG